MERLRRYYPREEEFLRDYDECATAAASLLDWAWHPREDCDDVARQQQNYFLSTGELTVLMFDGAAVYQDAGGRFTSAQVVLKSSIRVVTIRVRDVEGALQAERVVDRSL